MYIVVNYLYTSHIHPISDPRSTQISSPAPRLARAPLGGLGAAVDLQPAIVQELRLGVRTISGITGRLQVGIW